MSYGLDLHSVGSVLDGNTQQLSFMDLHAQWPAMPQPNMRQHREKIVRDILKITPDLTMNNAPDCIELSGRHSLQIKLYVEEASITLPYTLHEDNTIAAAFAQIAQFAQIIEDRAGFVTEDPQLGCIVDWQRDLTPMMTVYQQTSARIASINRMRPLF